jgi:hypothetical protein
MEVSGNLQKPGALLQLGPKGCLEAVVSTRKLLVPVKNRIPVYTAVNHFSEIRPLTKNMKTKFLRYNAEQSGESADVSEKRVATIFRAKEYANKVISINRVFCTNTMFHTDRAHFIPTGSANKL